MPNAKKNLGAILLTVYLDLVGFSIIFPLLPGMLDYYLKKEGSGGLLGTLVNQLDAITGGGHYTAVLFGGIIGSIYSLMQFVFAPVWGSLSDRLGRKHILRITLAGTALGYLIWIFSGSFLLLLISRIVSGIMAGNLSVATAAVADLTSREKRSHGMAIVGALFGLGFITGPAIGALASKYNPLTHFAGLESIGITPFSLAALIAFGLSLVNILWLSTHFKESHDTTAQTANKAPRSAWKSIQGIFTIQQPVISRTVWIYFIFITAFSGMEFTLTFFAAERFNYTPARTGLIFVYIGVLLVIIQGGLVRRLIPLLGEKRLTYYGLAFGIVAFLLLSNAHTQGMFFASLTFMALAGGILSPTLTALVSLYADEQEQGKHLGLFRAAGSFGRAIGPLLAAGTYWYMGSRTAYLLAACIILIPLIRTFQLPKPNKEQKFI